LATAFASMRITFLPVLIISLSVKFFPRQKF
jgi:hypothetical protein